jgi:hypothetical protein
MTGIVAHFVTAVNSHCAMIVQYSRFSFTLKTLAFIRRVRCSALAKAIY